MNDRDGAPIVDADASVGASERLTAWQTLADRLGLRSPNYRQTLLQWITLALVIGSALMMWKGLILVTRSESPVVVVLSGSMEPGLRRGDLLLLERMRRPTEVGEIVVFNVRGRDVPIVHRVLKVHDATRDGRVERLLLTKGDNNFADDVGLYAPGQRWLSESDIVGRAIVFAPYFGMLTILMNDYPWFKVLLLGSLGYFVASEKE